MSTIITISNLWAGYEQEPILEDINLTIQELDFLGIIGPNGGGKTTLLKVLLGLIKPWRGEVSILGQSVQKGRELVVKMGRLSSKKLWQGYSKKDEVRVDKALDSVGMLALKKRSIAELSGGQRQRVYIARALAVEPRLLILDEPTASVDPQMRASIFSLLQELNEWMTILIISHDLGTLSTYVKSIGCLNRRLYYHGQKSLTAAMLEQVYC
jgi:zinc transport system ATP-binding protein